MFRVYGSSARSPPSATVSRSGDGWTITVAHTGAGFASLRANVTDAQGNSVEQTIVRAYQVGS